MYRWALLALFVVSPCWGQSVKLPAELKADRGRLIRVPVTYEGDDVAWRIDARLDSFREYDPDPKSVRLVVLIPPNVADGEYELAAIAAKGGKLSTFSVCKIVVGQAPGPVPPPGPTPGPVDPLLGVLSSAYHADVSDTKADDVKQLAAVYRQAAKETVRRPELTRLGEIRSTVGKAISGLMEDRLSGVRQAVAAELRRTLPTDAEAPLDTALRDKVAGEFTRLAKLLDQLK